MAGGAIWEEEEKLRFIEMFPYKSNTDLALAFQRSVYSVNTLGFKLGLKKDSYFLAALKTSVGRQNLKSPRTYTIDQTFFRSIDTEEKAYFLGLLYADGSIYETTINKFVVRIALQERDKEILEKFLSCLHSDRPLYYDANKRQYALNVNSAQMYRDLTRHGIVERKTYKDIFPMEVPAPLLHHYIRGVFDGDGCICGNTKSRMGATIATRLAACYWIKSKVSSCLEVGGYVLDRKTYGIWGLTGRNQLIKFASWLYKDASVFLFRKRAKFLEAELCQ